MNGIYDEDTSAIIQNLYPIVQKALSKKGLNPLKRVIGQFIEYNHDLLFALGPYDRIYFGQSDINNLFDAIGISENDAIEAMKDCYFWDKPLNPACAKEPYIQTLLMVIRYCLLTKKPKDAELISIYLAFSGKIYASVHGQMFPKAPPSKYKTVMDYVINSKLSGKFNIRKEGSLFGAIKVLCQSWLSKYEGVLTKTPDDKDLKTLVQQIRDRVKDLISNIAEEFYIAYDQKTYLNYETDNFTDGASFRITDSDAQRAARLTESVMTSLTSQTVSLDICNRCKDQNIKASEIKDIMQAIVMNPQNHQQLRQVINIIICDFMRNYSGKEISSIDFIQYTLKSKPNSKDKYINDMKNTITGWLDSNSENYRRRKSRIATQNSYYKAILIYLTLVISKASSN